MKYYLLFIKNRGLSLMEVLTTVVIISILSSISYTGWRKYVRQAIYTEVKANLSKTFASQAQYKATCGIYHPDLKTIGAIPVGKLHYNVGATFDTAPAPPDPDINTWGSCLTDRALTCSDCGAYFEDVCKDGNTPCDEAMFNNFNSACPCYIKADYKVTKTNIESHHTASNYCGISHGVTENKLCIIAASAINRNLTDPAQWDVWVVNHLNIVKQVASPGN